MIDSESDDESLAQITVADKKKPDNLPNEVAEMNLRILEDEKYSDFTFIVGNRKFKVHKNILAAASPVFDRMFSSPMTEAQTNEANIDEIEPEVFKHLLRFIYGRKLPENLADVAVALELFKAAHYYEIERLQEICCANIRDNINVENAVDVYELAHVYDLIELENESWEFIKR
jgi:speckle-type POZ protein